MRATHAAICALESATTQAAGIEGVVLRYSFFYGPGTAIGPDPDAEQIIALRRRMLPVLGDGTGVWSFTHVEDAAAAVVAALEAGQPVSTNVVDDDPAPVAEWLPALARAAGAPPPPMRIPQWIGRLTGGQAAVAMMCEIRGAANAKAKAQLKWTPAWPTWRDGFPPCSPRRLSCRLTAVVRALASGS